jgi:SAM-dependent methyltransferase
MRLLKRALRRLLPLPVLDAYRRARYGQTWFDYQDRSAKEVFTHIYRKGVWGGTEGDLYSGPGSDPAVTAPYVDAVRGFIESHGIRSVVDLGCGDFRVGSRIVSPGLRYHGIDIVDDVVRHNQQTHGTAEVSFSCRDATRDELPAADLCLVREVLQHLSNAEILKVLARCRQFRYVIVTEAVAAPDRFTQPNIDTDHSPFTRADTGSGVVLEAAPFHAPVARTLVETERPDGIILRSVLLEHPAGL